MGKDGVSFGREKNGLDGLTPIAHCVQAPHLVEDDRDVPHVQRREPASDVRPPAEAALEGRDEADGHGDDDGDDHQGLHPLIEVTQQGLFHDPRVHGVGLVQTTNDGKAMGVRLPVPGRGRCVHARTHAPLSFHPATQRNHFHVPDRRSIDRGRCPRRT